MDTKAKYILNVTEKELQILKKALSALVQMDIQAFVEGTESPIDSLSEVLKLKRTLDLPFEFGQNARD